VSEDDLFSSAATNTPHMKVQAPVIWFWPIWKSYGSCLRTACL